MRSVHRALALATAVALLTGACTVPTDESAQAIASEQLPDALRTDVTSSTTTTTVAVLTRTVPIFLLERPEETERTLAVGVDREVPPGASFADTIGLLFGEGVVSEEELTLGYFNNLFEFELLEAGVEDGIATIDITLTSEGEEVAEPSAEILEGVAAQLVYTATALAGVDKVRILRDGAEITVPSDEPDQEPGALLDADDYERYNPAFVPPTPTSTEAPPSTSTEAPTTTTVAGS
ncbi:MAG: GerMN domain-containing protein [Acidimicrobiales bacterium]